MDTLKKIGPYQIIKRIAEGGMAEVYLGKTESRFGVSKLVAIKTTLQNGDPEQLKEMFFNEIRMSANLNHQNIVKIYDFGEFDDRGYMAMEYINGVTLRELMTYLRDHDERLTSSFILYIVHQVALGLAYAYHSVDPQTGRPLKLIHRDISPHNILISFEGEVKIIDFGIATGTKDKDLENLGHIKGKVAYMSPEQIQGKDVESGSDIFALGVILWELLANERFHTGTSVKEVKESIQKFDVAHLCTKKMSDRAEELLGILPIMLHHDPAKRAADANELARLLGTVLSAMHPDFSALALADYLKDIFSTVYSSNLEHIRASAHEDEKTLIVAAEAEVVSDDNGELDEFETKIAEGSYHSGVKLEKLNEPPPPLAPPKLEPLHDSWGSVLTPKFQTRVAVIPFYQFPKMRKKPKPQSHLISWMMVFTISLFVVLASGISLDKFKFTQKKALPDITGEVPNITLAMIQRLRMSIQQQPLPPAPVTTAAAALPKPSQASYVNRKAVVKSRTVASSKPAFKVVQAAAPKSVKRKELDLSQFKNGVPYPSGAKCLNNCPIKIGAQED